MDQPVEGGYRSAFISHCGVQGSLFFNLAAIFE
jgi:hypothetical protein